MALEAVDGLAEHIGDDLHPHARIRAAIRHQHPRGVFDGLTLSHDIGHLWRALLEAYAYACAHHVEVLRDMGHSAARVLVSDGGSNSRVWMQIVADVLGQPVHRLKGHPGSSLGAAWTAAVGVGLADWQGIARFVQQGEVLAPNPAHADTYAAGYRRYRALYRTLEAAREPA